MAVGRVVDDTPGKIDEAAAVAGAEVTALPVDDALVVQRAGAEVVIARPGDAEDAVVAQRRGAGGVPVATRPRVVALQGGRPAELATGKREAAGKKIAGEGERARRVLVGARAGELAAAG